MITVLVALAALVALGALAWSRAGERARRPVGGNIPYEVAGLADESLPAPLGRAIPSGHADDSLLNALVQSPDPEDALRDDRRLLVDVLRMIADQHGAAEASLWRGEPPMPLAWSSGKDSALGGERELSLVSWVMQSDVIAFDGADAADTPTFAAAAVKDGEFAGAIALTFDAANARKILPTREQLRYWLPRHATRVGAMHELLRTRAEAARGNFRLRNAMRTAMVLQGTDDPLELETVLAVQSLEATGAEWSVLVRWDRSNETGEVRSVTPMGPSRDGVSMVRPGTLLGDVCLDGSPIAFTDARKIVEAGVALHDDMPIPADTGSLILVPIRRGKAQPVLGALACGHRTAHALTMSNARLMRDLGVVAAGALETAWAVEDQRRTARRDGLTGLANRRAFEEEYVKAVDWTDRQQGGVMALVLVDIDHFKNVNDTYGHEAGDRVLVAVAEGLLRDRRAIDVVARFGGEEIALILPSITVEGASEVAERLRARVELLRVQTNAGEVSVTASFGVALYRHRGGDADAVFERADAALYRAKNGGRNRVEFA
ncbi:MAG TPA: GGDEF domain-containing protein [Gemmatimonadaceae bacterium]|nr:GGDEF domain-containing protein [Gemmatimonadaceae bacterium]